MYVYIMICMQYAAYLFRVKLATANKNYFITKIQEVSLTILYSNNLLIKIEYHSNV